MHKRSPRFSLCFANAAVGAVQSDNSGFKLVTAINLPIHIDYLVSVIYIYICPLLLDRQAIEPVADRVTHHDVYDTSNSHGSDAGCTYFLPTTLSSLALKQFRVGAFATSSGSRFHELVARSTRSHRCVACHELGLTRIHLESPCGR